MATMPSKRFVLALAVGLALAGVVLVGPAPLGESAGHLSTYALAGAPAFEDPAPPPPPDTDAPENPRPTQGAPPPHRRHIDGDPIIER
jgi:hypothetical protein